VVWLVVQESEAEGQAMLLEEEGVSVISDVDDTLRISVVGKLSHYFKSTFLKEFEDVHGMAELYQVYASLSCVPCRVALTRAQSNRRCGRARCRLGSTT
jgi:phosphatidate phosphatase APP1